MVKCELCGKEFRAVSNTHLKRHLTTVSQYKQQFPDANLYSNETLQKCAAGGASGLTSEQRSANGRLLNEYMTSEKRRDST